MSRTDLIAQKLMSISLEDGGRLIPKIKLDPKVFNDLCEPWCDVLIITLLGKTIGYKVMKERLQKLWKPKGGFEILDVDNNYFLVKIDLQADKERVTSWGPWMLFYNYLCVAHWTPEFASPSTIIKKTLVWVRFPVLNLLYYDESVLLGIASVIGKPIRVDQNTLKVERGRFARICVEIDLSLPVVGRFWLDDHCYRVEYEGLHLICSTCGCYSHVARNCEGLQQQESQDTITEDPPVQIDPLSLDQPDSIASIVFDNQCLSIKKVRHMVSGLQLLVGYDP